MASAFTRTRARKPTAPVYRVPPPLYTPAPPEISRAELEVLKDTAARLAPLTAPDTLAMLDELRVAPALKGVRGEAPVDRAALAETIVRFLRGPGRLGRAAWR
jgi:hypothetical protein